MEKKWLKQAHNEIILFHIHISHPHVENPSENRLTMKNQ